MAHFHVGEVVEKRHAGGKVGLGHANKLGGEGDGPVLGPKVEEAPARTDVQEGAHVRVIGEGSREADEPDHGLGAKGTGSARGGIKGCDGIYYVRQQSLAQNLPTPPHPSGEPGRTRPDGES